MSEGAGHSPSEMQRRWHELRQREGAATGILPLAGPSAARRFVEHDHSWKQSWGQSRGSPWAHLLTQASVSEEGPLRQEHHSPGAKAGQHLDAPCTETHSCQACSASQQLPTTPCAVLPHEVANKSQKRYICNTGQSNESQSRVCDRDGWHSPSQGGTGLTTPHCHLPNSGQPWLRKRRLW